MQLLSEQQQLHNCGSSSRACALGSCVSSDSQRWAATAGCSILQACFDVIGLERSLYAGMVICMVWTHLAPGRLSALVNGVLANTAAEQTVQL